MGMSTATGAVKEETYTIIFKDKHHKDFYMEYLPRCRCQDVYHKALVPGLKSGHKEICRTDL